MNFSQIAGRVGKDPETRFTPSGKKVITFSLATNRKKKGVDETVWYRVTVWGDQYDNMMPYIKKGSALIVVGDLEARIYTDKEGKPQLSNELTAWNISFSPFGKPDSKEEGGSQASSYTNQNYSNQNQNSYSNDYSQETQRGSYQGAQTHTSNIDDELPF